MTIPTWDAAFAKLQEHNPALKPREGQRALGDAVINISRTGGVLFGECPVGTGKSAAYLVPFIERVLGDHPKERIVISTETTTLQDQLIDKDLPFFTSVFGKVKFRALKGRSWYLCKQRAAPGNQIIEWLGSKDIGEGERRDVERVLHQKLSEDEWSEVAGHVDFCAQNKCTAERGCYSTRARQLAVDASIVVTNHALLRTHAEMEDGILGDFQHLVVDEAHTLEKVLIDGWGEELSPYELRKSMDAIWDGLDTSNFRGQTIVAKIEEAERLAREALESAVTLHRKLAERRTGDELTDALWRRESFALSEQYLSGAIDPSLMAALEDYELNGPGRFTEAAKVFKDLEDKFKLDIKDRERVPRKLGKGKTAATRLARVFDMLGESLTTRDGIVVRYGVPYVAIGDGYKAWKGGYDIKIRCVPLDVSRRAYDTIFKDLKSAILVSGTLRDETDGSFRYLRESLGIPQAKELVVGSSFDFSTNQLVYLTPATEEIADVSGARYSVDELVRVLEAAQGRALVLFTANAELEYASDHLRDLRQRGLFDHPVHVQEKGVAKQDLVRAFLEEKSSVLLGSKSFFTGVDFPGETCSIVVLAKFPLPQYNALCKAQIAWWRGRGHRQWYEREALQVFKQANGRLIRNENDRGVIAILDQRVADPRERVCDLTRIELTATGSAFTNNLEEMEAWLNTV